MGVRQCNGKFDGIVQPGCHVFVCPMGQINPVKMRINQLNTMTQTKTKDDVTVMITTAIQWEVNEDKVEQYYFKLTNPTQQISSYVDDIMRSELPTRTLDEAFAEKDKMGMAAEKELRVQLTEAFGISVQRVLITDLRPDQNVLNAMNAINAAKRDRLAAQERAEAQKILTVVAAEAEKDAKQLGGQGLALQRQAIASGFKNSIVDLTGDASDSNLSPEGVVHMMLVTQYLDILKDFAGNNKSALVVPHGAGFVKDIEKQVKGGFAMHPSGKARGPSKGSGSMGQADVQA